jgi:hypothetical protein
MVCRGNRHRTIHPSWAKLMAPQVMVPPITLFNVQQSTLRLCLSGCNRVVRVVGRGRKDPMCWNDEKEAKKKNFNELLCCGE